MKKWILFVAGIFALFIFGVLIVISIHLEVMQTAEPRYSGRIQLPELDSGVRVVFDKYTVPHIEASNESDLYTVAGYLAASERMWQMDTQRLLAQGRLAEVAGSEALTMDRLMRTIGLERTAAALRDFLSDHTIAAFQAYANGINAYLYDYRNKLPVEYRLLDYRPEPWTVDHTILLTRLFAWEMNIAWHLDVVLGAMVDRLGERMARQVFPVYPDSKPYIIPQGTGEFTRGLLPVLRTDEKIRGLFGGMGTHMGSNSWVLSGDRTASGKPLLANDPHMLLMQPCRWYEMHLRTPEINVRGMTFPGAPGVVIGVNDSIAWGLTNVMADDADFFIETLNPGDSLQYRYQGEWRSMETYQEIIRVKDAPDDTMLIRETHHGPVITDVHPAGNQMEQAISMRWTGHEMSDEFDALYKINTASDWEEFSAGTRRFHVPGQNFVYADRAGNIGYRPGVKIPIRARGNGNIPVPGNVTTYEWTGFVPMENLPFLYNPEDGYIATANNKVVDEDVFQYHISNLYEPPSRIERIRELLEGKKTHDIRDIRRYQTDVVSPHAREVTRYFLEAFNRVEPDDTYLNHAIAKLGSWNGSMDQESVAAAIFSVAFQRLIRNLYQDEMGDTLLYHFTMVPNAPIRNISWLLDEPFNIWWDDVSTPGTESRNDILQRSLFEAVQWLKNQYGRSMINWQWGNLHKVKFSHIIGRGSGLADLLYGFNLGPFEIGGSGTTVNAGVYSYQSTFEASGSQTGMYGSGASFDVMLGPSARIVADLSEKGAVRGIVYSGQSGHPFSSHYADQTTMWRRGEYRKLAPSFPEQVEDVLTFVPNLSGDE